MKYSRFEELPVWNAAIELALRVYKVTQDRAFLRQRSLRDQLERGTTQDLLKFIYIARGSAGEVRSMLCLIERLDAFNHLKFEISNLKSLAEEIPRQLRGWADFLQNSPIKGQRHLNSKTRRADQGKRDREQLLEELRRVQTTNSAAAGAK